MADNFTTPVPSGTGFAALNLNGVLFPLNVLTDVNGDDVLGTAFEPSPNTMLGILGTIATQQAQMIALLTQIAGNVPTVTLGTLSLSTALTSGTVTNGTILGATAGSTITSAVTGLTINSAARTFSFDGTGASGTVSAGLVETEDGATNSPHGSSVTVAAAAITLGNLTLSPSTATVGTAYTGAVTGKNGASTLALSGAGAAGLTLSGSAVSGTPTAAGTVNLVETLAGATNSPRTTIGVATVTAASVTLATLSLSSTAFSTGGVTSVGINGKTTGSTITATSSDGTVLTVSGTTLSGTFNTAGLPTISLVETLAGATGSPKTTPIVVTVSAAQLRLYTDAPTYNFASPYTVTSLPTPAYTQSVGSRQIVVDTTTKDTRSWLGVGAAITDATCYDMMTLMSAAQRTAFLTKVFQTDGFSLVRICMGDSDFSTAYATNSFATYDDTDPVTATTLPNFSIAKDMARIVPILQQLKAINPAVKIFAMPWSPPAILKGGSFSSTNNLCGGYMVNSAANFTWYANYFVKFLQAYQALGLLPDYIAVQNEPNAGPTNYPSCTWAAADITQFIGGYLGPALAAAGLSSVKILSGDCSYGDTGTRDTAALADATAGPYTAGSGYHGYDGSSSTMAATAAAYPSKEIHMTENSFQKTTGAGGTVAYTAARLGVDVPRAQSQSILWWCLALDSNGMPGPTYSPYNLSAPAYINSDGSVSYQPEYAILAHLGQNVQRGAKRVASSFYGTIPNDAPGDVQSVAWLNPDGSRVAFVVNASTATQTVSVIDQAAGSATVDTPSITANSIATVKWPALSAAVNPALPPAIKLVAGNGKVTVSLLNNPPANGGSAITGYNLYGATTSGAEVLVASNVTLPADITGLTNGNPYYVKAAAVTSGGTLVGAMGAEANATPVNVAHVLNFTGVQNADVYGTSSATTSSTTNIIDAMVHLNYQSYAAGSGGTMLLAGNVAATGATKTTADWSLGSYNTAGYPTFTGYNTAGTYVSATGAVAWTSATYKRAVNNGSTSAYTTVFPVGGSTVAGANSGGAPLSIPAGSTGFFESTDGITWTQLGAFATTWGTGGINKAGAGRRATAIGSISATAANTAPTGSFYRFTVTDGTTTLEDIDFTNQATGATTFTANVGGNWTIYPTTGSGISES